MKIERNNYEEFFLDYFEDSLPAEKVAELFLFLENNPDLKEEFDRYSATEIPSPSQTVFEDKNSLIKPVVDNINVEEYMLRSIDGYLSGDEVLSLENFLASNPIAKKEYDLLCKTKLKAESVFYAHKLNLRKKGIDLYNYQTYLVADMEGDLDIKQQEELKNFLLLHPEIKNEKTLLSRTVLKKERIEYPEKNSLKKAVPLYAFNYTYLAVAAAACIVLLLGVWFYNPQDISSPDLVEEVSVQNSDPLTNETNSILLSEEELNSNAQQVEGVGISNVIEPLIASSDQVGVNQLSTNKSADNNIIELQNLLACEKIDIDNSLVNDINQNTASLENIIYSKPDQEMLALISEFYDTPQNSKTENTQLATLAKRNLSRMADESYVASTVLDDDKKGGRKLFELVASGIGKISNDKMQLNGRFNDQDELVAYQLQSNKVNLKNKY